MVISAVILAAGKSERMGKPKQLLRLNKFTLVEQTIGNFLNSKVSEIIVVLGYRAEEVKRNIAAKPVKIAMNPNYKQGMSTSIMAGLNSADSGANAIMLALADQPFIDAQTINRLVEAFDTREKGIVIPVYEGRRGHPIIFDIKYKKELLKLRGDIGGREVIKRYSNDVLEVAVNCPGIYRDIDTESNYRHAIGSSE